MTSIGSILKGDGYSNKALKGYRDLQEINKNGGIAQNADGTYSISANDAFKLFNDLQMDSGKTIGGNGTDFAVGVIDKEIEKLQAALKAEGLTTAQKTLLQEEIGILSAIKAADADGNGQVSATEMNKKTKDGKLTFNANTAVGKALNRTDADILAGLTDGSIKKNEDGSFDLTKAEANKLFTDLQLDLGVAKPGTNGSDFSVGVINAEIAKLKAELKDPSITDEQKTQKTLELELLQTIRSADTDGNGVVSATEFNKVNEDGMHLDKKTAVNNHSKNAADRGLADIDAGIADGSIVQNEDGSTTLNADAAKKMFLDMQFDMGKNTDFYVSVVKTEIANIDEKLKDANIDSGLKAKLTIEELFLKKVLTADANNDGKVTQDEFNGIASNGLALTA